MSTKVTLGFGGGVKAGPGQLSSFSHFLPCQQTEALPRVLQCPPKPLNELISCITGFLVLVKGWCLPPSTLVLMLISFSPTEDGSSLEEIGFNWGEYLEETGARAAPHTSFKHVSGAAGFLSPAWEGRGAGQRPRTNLEGE